MLFNLTFEDKTSGLKLSAMTWGDMIHIVKKSGRESNSSVMYLILWILVVMKNPTKECES
jgi:hypothetical protein